MLKNLVDSLDHSTQVKLFYRKENEFQKGCCDGRTHLGNGRGVRCGVEYMYDIWMDTEYREILPVP